MTANKHSPNPSALTPETETMIVRCLIGVFAVLVIASAVLSSTGLHALGVAAGVHPVLAWLVPVACDGLVAAGLLAGLYGTLSRTGTTYAWVLVIIGTGMSVAGNVAAAPESLTARLVHAGAPVVLALSLEAVLGPVRSRAGLPVRRARKATPVPAIAPATPALVQTSAASTEPSTRKQRPVMLHADDTQAGKPMSKAATARTLLAADPTLSVAALVEKTGIDKSEARKIRARLIEQVAA